MPNLLIRLVINAVALAATAYILPGIEIADDGLLTLLLIAVVFGLLNALVKPLLACLTLPFIILSAGIFLLVLNAIMLLITDGIVGSAFEVDGFWWALLGGIVISVINMLFEGAFGLEDDEEAE
jgi:putative membrane protein